MTSSSRRLDGRWVLGLLVLIVYALLFAAPGRPSLVAAWSAYGVDHRAPAFLDLRVVTAGADAARAGLDPIAENPHDPLQRPMNHPRVWTLLRHVGLSEHHTVPLGFCLTALFLAAVLTMVGRLTIREAIFYAVLVCSPAALMAIERGNVDVLLFCLLSGAALLVVRARTRVLAYAVVFLCAMLKLFPVFGFALALRERLRTGVIVLATAAAAFAAYLFVTRHDVATVISNSIQGVFLSFGRKVFFERLRDGGVALNPNAYSAVAVLIVLAVALFIAMRVRLPNPTPGAMEKMLIGCGIYCGSFVLLSNFNYRLIFLLLAVPQLLAWRGEGGKARRFADAALFILALAFCLSGQLRSSLFLLKEGANWLIFAASTGILLQVALDWLRGASDVQPGSNAPSAAGSFTGA